MDKLRATVAEALGIDEVDLPADASTENVAEWTSLQHLTVIAAVEERFRIQMTMDDMTSAQSLSALSKIVDTYCGVA